jgi:MFS family permease
MSSLPPKHAFAGWRVVQAAFLVATFGWGVGFYGPPVFLHAVQEARGWPVAIVSAAVTAHFLAGALVVAGLARLHRRFGVAAVTRAGAVLAALGVLGWALAPHPALLFAATALSGAGWAMTGAAAINAIVSPWFVRRRPAALGMAFNGASLGGVVGSPLWVALIAWAGFPVAAAVIGAAMVAVLWWLSARVLAVTPAMLGQVPDGDAPGAAAPGPAREAPPLGRRPWVERRFATLAAANALGLFAQIGLIAHLLSLMVPALGVQGAGLAMGLGTACAVAGRTALGWVMPPGADRRVVLAVNYAVQVAGSVLLLASGGESVALLLAGVLLFGLGLGNATSLPPLVAQWEFGEADVARVVALVTAFGQAAYAFAPAAFGVLREGTPGGEAVFVAAAVVQGLALGAALAGRR